jgi:hypothetical protein
LVKNDPCRAKGRTNVELREKFILREGVTQQMESFKSKRSPLPQNGSQSGSSYGSPLSTSTPRTPGPITKIREKTERSVPMYKQREHRGHTHSPGPSESSLLSLDTGTPERRLSDLSNADRPRSRRDNSRPGSRNSNISEEGHAPTRIPSIRRKSQPKPAWR